MAYKVKDPWTTILVQASDTTTHDKPKKATKTTTIDSGTHKPTVQDAITEIRASDRTFADAIHAATWKDLGITTGIILIFIIIFLWIIYIVVSFSARLFKWVFRVGTKDSDGFAKVNYKIPHCDTEKTESGFVVKFARKPVWLEDVDPLNDNLVVAFLKIPFFVVGSVIDIARSTLKPTRIEATRDAVIINGTKYRREDFGTFYISYTRAIKRDSRKKYAVIAFDYGRQKRELSYLWREDEATAFLASLNTDLAALPTASDTSNPSPEALRQNLAQDDKF